jgi:hypothetical protein
LRFKTIVLELFPLLGTVIMDIMAVAESANGKKLANCLENQPNCTPAAQGGLRPLGSIRLFESLACQH